MTQITLEVLAEKIDGLKELTELKFTENSKEHTSVIAHQKITNGRVNLLESWKSNAMGVFFVVNAIFIPILFIVLSKVL